MHPDSLGSQDKYIHGCLLCCSCSNRSCWFLNACTQWSVNEWMHCDGVHSKGCHAPMPFQRILWRVPEGRLKEALRGFPGRGGGFVGEEACRNHQDGKTRPYEPFEWIEALSCFCLCVCFFCFLSLSLYIYISLRALHQSMSCTLMSCQDWVVNVNLSCHQQEASITWCDLVRPKRCIAKSRNMLETITSYDDVLNLWNKQWSGPFLEPQAIVLPQQYSRTKGRLPRLRSQEGAAMQRGRALPNKLEVCCSSSLTSWGGSKHCPFWASRDVMLATQMCASKLQRVFLIRWRMPAAMLHAKLSGKNLWRTALNGARLKKEGLQKRLFANSCCSLPLTLWISSVHYWAIDELGKFNPEVANSSFKPRARPS